MRRIAVIVSLLLAGQLASAEILEFRISNGTGRGAWNTETTIVEAKLGDTVKIINDDSVNHQLHTNGSPCAHGPLMVPGAAYDCLIVRPFDPFLKSGPLYDHGYGPSAAFWIRAVN